MRKPNAGIIIQSTALLILAVVFWCFFVAGLVSEYPTAESLVYEECTFEKYKKVKHERENNRIEENYYIYVEEYPLFLVIDNSVFDKTDETVLAELEAGDKLLISTYYYAETDYVQAMSHNGIEILSYEDSVAKKIAMDRRRTIIAFVFGCIMTTGLVVGIVSYNKTGNVILLVRKYRVPNPYRLRQ